MSRAQGDPSPSRRGEDHLRLLIESVKDFAIFTMDPQGHFTEWNAGAERILGYSDAEILGQDAARIFTREDVARGAPEIELRTALTEGRAEDERWHVRKDGSRFWASGVVTPMRDADGTLRGFAKVMRDLTERKRLEASLAASEARFRSIAEQSPVLIWRSAADGSYDYFNRPWYDFRGRGPEDELGLGWAEGIHPDDRRRYLDVYRSSFDRREAFEVTFRLRRHDGRYRWVIDRGVPYHDDAGSFLGYLGSCMDITERIELEAALQEQRALAEEAATHKTRLLSALSHDARTPLNAVVLAAQLLEMHLQGHADPEIEANLRTIRHAVGNVLDLLGDLLNLTKIDAGAMPAEPSRFAAVPVMAECLSGIEPQARQKGLDVRLEPGALDGLSLETDRAKLKQVLSNLLSNALRYTNRGHVRLYAERSADQVRFRVEDTGEGIDPADQARVFDEFARLDHPHRPAGEGTGLGLAICRRLASLLGGEITLQSQPGRGSTFTLALPATVLVAEPIEKDVAGLPASQPASGTVLVAEDHLASRQALAKVLRRMGYRVLEAGNGRDALALARRSEPSAILMDVNMPVMDGIDATLALRADPTTKDVPIFALTGDVTLVNRRRIGEAGVDGYLEKPVTFEALSQALAKVQGRGQ